MIALCEPAGPLEQMHKVVDTLRSQLRKAQDHKIIGRLLWPFRLKDMNLVTQVIGRLKTVFVFALGNDTAQMNLVMSNEIQGI